MSSILASLNASPTVTIVNMTTGTTVATGIKVKSLKIHLISKTQGHMREDGMTLTDARIIHGTEIQMDIICPTVDDVSAVTGISSDRQNLYAITSKGLYFANMMAELAQNKQTSEMLTASPFTWMWKEQLLENVAPVICSQAGDSDTQDNGLQLLNNIGNNVNNFITTVRTNAANALSQGGSFFKD